MLRAFLIAAVALVALSGATRIIRSSATKHYELFNAVATGGYKSWTQAKAFCEAQTYLGQPGQMAMVKDSAINDKIIEFYADSAVDRFWLGGRRQADGKWYWNDGELFSNSGACAPAKYCNWRAGEPNGQFDPNSFSLAMEPPGQWNDHTDSYGFPYQPEIVCEYAAIIATQDPAVAAFCDSIATQCAELEGHCVLLQSTMGAECDATVTACNDVHADCETKAATCTLQ
jgi:hypothetical protein